MDEEEEEAIQPKLLRDPGDPSPQEIAEHNVTHMPYRAWCAHCVAGRGKADPHRRVAEAAKQEGIPVMSADYAFLGQDDQPDNVTLWVMRDHAARCTFAHVCHNKGASDGWIVEQALADIDSIGADRMVLKTGGEPATVEVQGAIKRSRSQKMKRPYCAMPRSGITTTTVLSNTPSKMWLA